MKPAQRMSESELMSSLGFKRLAWLIVTKNLQEDRIEILQQFHNYILPTHRRYVYKIMFIGKFRGVRYHTIPFMRDVTSDKLDLGKLKQHYLNKIVVIDGHVKRSDMG